MPKPKQVYWDNKWFSSLTAAAEYEGVSVPLMSYYIKKGYKSRYDLANKRAVYWGGVKYPSVSELARTLSVHHKTVSRWVDAGYTCIEDVPTYQFKWEFGGKQYVTKQEIANERNVNIRTVRRWIRDGIVKKVNSNNE